MIIQVLSLDLVKAGVATLFIVALDLIFELLIKRKFKDQRKSMRYRVSLRYTLFFCFLFVMAKIWVDGFGFLLTFIGIVAAAFTITQKEYLMNLIGWLIIMWRDIFSEGDFIEIGKYRGFVKHIGPLYFSIEESSEYWWGEKSGRVIRIPNNTVATNPIVNFVDDRGFIEGNLVYIFTFESSQQEVELLAQQLVSQIEQFVVERINEWNAKQQHEFSRLKRRASDKPQYILQIQQHCPAGIKLKLRYLSLKQDQKRIESKIFELVLNAVNQSQKLELTVGT